MKFYSTNNHKNIVDFRTAVINGIADDGGLYMPVEIPVFRSGFVEALPDLTLQEIGFEIIRKYVDSISMNDLQNIVEKAIDFDAPVKFLADDLSILELFHGPTLAFKDFGARFLANLLAHYNQNEDKELVILVATSGDTGSAVGNSFLGLNGIKVGLLYPGGMVSLIQEKQLTTMGQNISAFEIDGAFDDCQRLVKTAFADPELKKRFNLSSANSINVARFLPQSFYYIFAYGQFSKRYPGRELIFTVPSGNFGNLTAGLVASKMGLPVHRFIAAVNSNKIFPNYLETGEYRPAKTIKTISNAMDVGDPSNFVRVAELFEHDHEKIKKNIYSNWASDKETSETIRKIFEKFNYIIDPHGAVGCCVLDKYRQSSNDRIHSIVLETAHPAKFADIVEPVIDRTIEMPERLAACLEKTKKTQQVSSGYPGFRDALLQML
jgi:threonine synthase